MDPLMIPLRQILQIMGNAELIVKSVAYFAYHAGRKANRISLMKATYKSVSHKRELLEQAITS